jgi:hypothetical protein
MMSEFVMEREKTCLACGADDCAGLRLLQRFLCTECERQLVQTDVDAPQYEDWVRMIKKIWV